MTGQQGRQGNQGRQGFQGMSGQQGSRGFQGFTGMTGQQGQQGKAGKQGNQGFTGMTGMTGMTGQQGFQGSTGPQGAPGSSAVQAGVVSTTQGSWDSGTNVVTINVTLSPEILGGNYSVFAKTESSSSSTAPLVNWISRKTSSGFTIRQVDVGNVALLIDWMAVPNTQ
jgi:hypothetical protein